MNVHRQWAVTHASSSTLTSIQNRGKLTRSAAVSCAARILATCFLNSQICLCCFIIAFHPPDYGSRVLLHGIQKSDPRGPQRKGRSASNELAGEAGHFDSQPLALGTYSGPLAILHDHQKNNSRVRRFTSRGSTYAFWLCVSSASAWPRLVKSIHRHVLRVLMYTKRLRKSTYTKRPFKSLGCCEGMGHMVLQRAHRKDHGLRSDARIMGHHPSDYGCSNEEENEGLLSRGCCLSKAGHA